MSPQDWMASRDLTAADLAKEIGCAVSTITRPLNAERYPTFLIMAEFYRLSEKLVGLGDWILNFQDKDDQPGSRLAQGRRMRGCKNKAGRPRRQRTESAGRRGETNGRERTGESPEAAEEQGG